jgi:ABC-type nickel/cobalt efflux system permease component RcnA
MTETKMATRDAALANEPRRHPTPPHTITGVRETDLEPYIGLRYLSKLFRLMAIILILLLIAEVVTGFMQQGTTAIPTLLAEASRLVVFAGLLWGAGDLAILFIDMGHDVRATRILMARQLAHHMDTHHQHHRATDPAEPAATAAGQAHAHPAAR